MTLKHLPVFLSFFMLTGCWFSSHPVSMPLNESQFSKPVQKPLKWSSAAKIKWNQVPADSIHPGHIIPFDIRQFPSRPFNPMGMIPIPNPVFAESLRYDEAIDKIFRLFFTTKPAGQGTGLGLSMSYDIITKEHSGKIAVTTKENEYTELLIELPVQAA